jgi:hypothetical protein
MKILIKMIISTILCFSSYYSVAANTYLFDVLKKSEHLNSWNKLIGSNKNVDSWLLNYSKSKNGPATPAEIIDINSNKFEVFMVCKTHDCGDNRFYVIFSKNGDQAWGLLYKNNKNEKFFGNPDAEKISALRKATQM